MYEGTLVDTLEDVQKEITRQQGQYDKLIKEQKKQANQKDDRERVAKEYRDHFLKATNEKAEDEEKHRMQMASKQEQRQLHEDLEMTETAIKNQDAINSELQNATDVITLVPEREVVFRGAIGDVANPCPFEVKTQLKYPMEGGTALITFEEEIVAQKVLSLKHHKVTLEGECFVTVEAKPIQLLVPTSVKMDTRQCLRSILVSNLPSDMDSEALLDKLELHFGKSHHGGGEVASRHYQEDVGNAVLSFKDEGISPGLIKKEYHEVVFKSQKKQKVRVTPFVNGTITCVETRWLRCGRSVLLTGIPPVMDADSLQDIFEIYFQKGSHGGGEISNTLYNPLGKTTVAIFEDDNV
ncbi:hypothetical protein NHX12_032456 [Muraenolepis orangiensis]|uniref:NID domain-containing protein n=1 Tax=Muraenolepis orangiensis TaxID=630683 RepID=A0A9Q0E9F8_9TELE|nr:hypothetical protein NHX12_032456 [Muraenolepis orangiensis]